MFLLFPILLLVFLLQVPQEAAPVIVQQAINWTTVLLAVITGFPASIAAIGGIMALMQSRRNAEVAAVTDKRVEQANAKSDIIIEKAVEIHTLTNSNLAQVTASLATANQKIEGLQQLLMQMVHDKGVADRLGDKQATGSGVMDDKMNQLLGKMNEGAASNQRLEEGAASVASDLAAHQKKADEVTDAAPGAAADEAAKT